MRIKEEEKSLTLEYTVEIGHLIWSIPSVHNVTGKLSRGIVLLEGKPDKDSETQLVGYAVSKNYELTPLLTERLLTMHYIWNQITKHSDYRIIAIAGGNRAMSETQLRKALFENNLLGGKEYVKKHRGPDEPKNPQTERRMFFALEHEVPFGKHQGKTIREVIDKNPGWIAWALREIDENFLNVPARKYYNDRMRKKGGKKRGM